MIGTKSSDIAFVLLRKNVENLAYSKHVLLRNFDLICDVKKSSWLKPNV